MEAPDSHFEAHLNSLNDQLRVKQKGLYEIMDVCKPFSF